MNRFLCRALFFSFVVFSAGPWASSYAFSKDNSKITAAQKSGLLEALKNFEFAYSKKLPLKQHLTKIRTLLLEMRSHGVKLNLDILGMTDSDLQHYLVDRIQTHPDGTKGSFAEGLYDCLTVILGTCKVIAVLVGVQTDIDVPPPRPQPSSIEINRPGIQ